MLTGLVRPKSRKRNVSDRPKSGKVTLYDTCCKPKTRAANRNGESEFACLPAHTRVPSMVVVSEPAAQSSQPPARTLDPPRQHFVFSAAQSSQPPAQHFVLDLGPPRQHFVFSAAETSQPAGGLFPPRCGVDADKDKLRDENRMLNLELKTYLQAMKKMRRGNQKLREHYANAQQEVLQLQAEAELREKGLRSEYQRLKERVRAEYRELYEGQQAEFKKAASRVAAMLKEQADHERRRMKDSDLCDCEEDALRSMLEEQKAFTDRLQKQLLFRRAEQAVADTMPWTLCPIGLQLMRSPVQCSDGNTFSRTNIQRWLATSDKSPITNAVLDNLTLTPNHFARSVIEEAVAGKMKQLAEMASREL